MLPLESPAFHSEEYSVTVHPLGLEVTPNACVHGYYWVVQINATIFNSVRLIASTYKFTILLTWQIVILLTWQIVAKTNYKSLSNKIKALKSIEGFQRCPLLAVWLESS